MASDPPPPDRPTRRLQPSPPAYDEHAVRAAPDNSAILLRLEDAIASLRTGLMIVGVLAVAALGVAIYALVGEDEGSAGSRGGLASDARVSDLEDRVDRISRQVQDLRSADGGGEGVEDRVAALEETVQQLADRPSADPQQAIDQLSERIDDVAQDVEALQQNAPPP